jgi:hypothetical protein
MTSPRVPYNPLSRRLASAGGRSDLFHAFLNSPSRFSSDSYGAGDDWRVDNNDDMVLSVALALSAERIPSRRVVAFELS